MIFGTEVQVSLTPDDFSLAKRLKAAEWISKASIKSIGIKARPGLI